MTESGGVTFDKVVQKAYIDVNRDGTEAAAATAFLEGATGIREYLDVDIDRPFLFYLCNNKTGIILFMGKVVNPEYPLEEMGQYFR